jgi:hypothetical protein
MRRPIPRTNIEENQKLDRTLLERLAKAVEVLPNLED